MGGPGTRLHLSDVIKTQHRVGVLVGEHQGIELLHIVLAKPAKRAAFERLSGVDQYAAHVTSDSVPVLDQDARVATIVLGLGILRG